MFITRPAQTWLPTLKTRVFKNLGYYKLILRIGLHLLIHHCVANPDFCNKFRYLYMIRVILVFFQFLSIFMFLPRLNVLWLLKLHDRLQVC